jgi:hypothetical protein
MGTRIDPKMATNSKLNAVAQCIPSRKMSFTDFVVAGTLSTISMIALLVQARLPNDSLSNYRTFASFEWTLHRHDPSTPDIIQGQARISNINRIIPALEASARPPLDEE